MLAGAEVVGTQGRISVEPRTWLPPARHAIDILSAAADRGREMGKLARINAKKKFCAKTTSSAYERYYQRVLSESRAATA